jgi:hypothetical protein
VAFRSGYALTEWRSILTPFSIQRGMEKGELAGG